MYQEEKISEDLISQSNKNVFSRLFGNYSQREKNYDIFNKNEELFKELKPKNSFETIRRNRIIILIILIAIFFINIGFLSQVQSILKVIKNYKNIINNKQNTLLLLDLMNKSKQDQIIFNENFYKINNNKKEIAEFISEDFLKSLNYIKFENTVFYDNIFGNDLKNEKNESENKKFGKFISKIRVYYSNEISNYNLKNFINPDIFFESIKLSVCFYLTIGILLIVVGVLFLFQDSNRFTNKIFLILNFYVIYSILNFSELTHICLYFYFSENLKILLDIWDNFSFILMMLIARIFDYNFTIYIISFILKEITSIIIQYISLYKEENFFLCFNFYELLAKLSKCFLFFISLNLLFKLKKKYQTMLHLKDKIISYLYDVSDNFNEKYLFVKNHELYFANKALQNSFENHDKVKNFLYNDWFTQEGKNNKLRENLSYIFQNVMINPELPSRLKMKINDIQNFMILLNNETLMLNFYETTVNFKTNLTNNNDYIKFNQNITRIVNNILKNKINNRFKRKTRVSSFKLKNTNQTDSSAKKTLNTEEKKNFNLQIDSHLDYLINQLVKVLIQYNLKQNNSKIYKRDFHDNFEKSHRGPTKLNRTFTLNSNSNLKIFKKSYTDIKRSLRQDKKNFSQTSKNNFSFQGNKIKSNQIYNVGKNVYKKDDKAKRQNYCENENYILIGEKVFSQEENTGFNNNSILKNFKKLNNFKKDLLYPHHNFNHTNLKTSERNGISQCFFENKDKSEYIFIKYNKILDGFEILIKNSSTKGKSFKNTINKLNLKEILKLSLSKLCHEFRNPLLNILILVDSLKGQQNSLFKKIDSFYKTFSIEPIKSETSFVFNSNDLNEISGENSLHKTNSFTNKFIFPIINFNQNNLILKNNTYTNINQEIINENIHLNRINEEKDEDIKLNIFCETNSVHSSQKYQFCNLITPRYDSSTFKLKTNNNLKLKDDKGFDSQRKIINTYEQSFQIKSLNNIDIITDSNGSFYDSKNKSGNILPSIIHKNKNYKKFYNKNNDNNILSPLISSNFECFNENIIKIKSICSYLNYNLFEFEYLSNLVSKHNLTEYFLEIKEKITNNCSRVNIRKEIEPLVKLVRTKISLSNKKLNFNLLINEDTPNTLYLDFETIKKMLFLLIKNSIHFSNSGEIKLEICFKNNNLFFEINDNGIGIKENNIKNLGNILTKSRITNNIQGIGLGFFMFKIHLLVLNGDYNVKSKFGEGTNVIFSIPMQSSDDRSAYKLLVNNLSIDKEIIYQIEKSTFSNLKPTQSWENNFLGYSHNTESNILRNVDSIYNRKKEMFSEIPIRHQSCRVNSKFLKNFIVECDNNQNKIGDRNSLKNLGINTYNQKSPLHLNSTILRAFDVDKKKNSKSNFTNIKSLEYDDSFDYENSLNKTFSVLTNSEDKYNRTIQSKLAVNNNSNNKININLDDIEKNKISIINKKSTNSLFNLGNAIESSNKYIDIDNLNKRQSSPLNIIEKNNNIESKNKKENEHPGISFTNSVCNSFSQNDSSFSNKTVQIIDNDIHLGIKNLDLKSISNSNNCKCSENNHLYSDRESYSIVLSNNTSNKKLIILVVDDEELIRKSNVNFCKKFFKKLDFQDIEIIVEEAVDGIEALYKIFINYLKGIRFDFIITDETMSFMKGSLMAKIIKKFIEDNIFYDMIIGSLTSYDFVNIKANKNSIYFDFIGTKPISDSFLKKFVNIYKEKIVN